MNKQAILTRVATDCEKWSDVHSLAMLISAGYQLGEFTISYQEWLSERERLLNKPIWRCAPKHAKALALCEFTKSWYWYYSTPCAPRGGRYGWSTTDHTLFASEVIAIPRGYDWRESLELRPEPSNIRFDAVVIQNAGDANAPLEYDQYRWVKCNRKTNWLIALVAHDEDDYGNDVFIFYGVDGCEYDYNEITHIGPVITRPVK